MGMSEFAKLELAGPDTGLEEEGVGGKVWVEAMVNDHMIKGGDCFMEITHIEVVDQTVMQCFELEVVEFQQKFLVWRFRIFSRPHQR